MKKIFFLALIAIATGTSAFAGPASKSVKVNNHFKTTFKSASNVSWSDGEKYEQVTFTVAGEQMEAYYNNEGDLIGTIKKMDFAKLPKNAIETIATKYTFPEYQLTNCIEFTDADNNTSYFVSFDNRNESVIYEVSKTGRVSFKAVR